MVRAHRIVSAERALQSLLVHVFSDWKRLPPKDGCRKPSRFPHVVQSGPSPGLLAFIGETPVGWIQVTPRAAVPALAGMPRLRPVDDKPMWVITCLYVRVGYRRRGVTRALIEAAVGRARRAKAAGVEAYPLDATRSPSATGCGYASTFVAAGFTESVRRSAARPIMRKSLGGSD